MPNRIASAASEANSYGHPFVGPVEYRDLVLADVSDLTTNEVDALGYIKPGVPLDKSGNTVGAGVPVYGVTIEAIKTAHATIPPTNASLAADTGAFPIAVGTHGIVNRDIIEDNLGRALTADEIAGFALAGSHIHLTRT
jgi:hypothetical protein